MELPISKVKAAAEDDHDDEDDQDRISKLPDTLIYHIFTTYLDSHAIAQTRTLSKRWVNLWNTHEIGDAFRFNHCIRLRSRDFAAFSRVYSTCLIELVLTDCTNVHLLDWSLPSLIRLCLKNVNFGNQISGFENLKKLTVTGFTHEIFTIICLKLESVALGPDFSCCTLVVSAPNLSIFNFCSADHVPHLSLAVAFPCIKEVHIDIEIKDYNWMSYDSDMINLVVQNFITMFNAVRGTQWLWLSRQTIQALRRIPDFSAYQSSPFGNLKFLYLLGMHEKPTRSADHVIDYLLTNSPSAKIFHGDRVSIVLSSR